MLSARWGLCRILGCCCCCLFCFFASVMKFLTNWLISYFVSVALMHAVNFSEMTTKEPIGILCWQKRGGRQIGKCWKELSVNLKEFLPLWVFILWVDLTIAKFYMDPIDLIVKCTHCSLTHQVPMYSFCWALSSYIIVVLVRRNLTWVSNEKKLPGYYRLFLWLIGLGFRSFCMKVARNKCLFTLYVPNLIFFLFSFLFFREYV